MTSTGVLHHSISGHEGDMWRAGGVAASGGVPEVIYYRQLPGAGFVSIQAIGIPNPLGQDRFYGEVVVERRTPDRRKGHEPPVVARAEGVSHTSLLHQLFPMTQSTALLAAACLELAARNRR